MRKGRRDIRTALRARVPGRPSRRPCRHSPRAPGSVGTARPDDRRGRLGCRPPCPSLPSFQPAPTNLPLDTHRQPWNSRSPRGGSSRSRLPSGATAQSQGRSNGTRGWRDRVSKGRSKVRLEAPLGSELVAKIAGQTTRFGLASLLDGPERTPPRSGVDDRGRAAPLGFYRGRLGASRQAMARSSPAAMVPLSVGFNVLTPEPAEVNLHCLAELRPIRGGEPIWRGEWREIIATNALELTRHPLSIVTPRGSGRDLRPGDQDNLGAAGRRRRDSPGPLRSGVDGTRRRRPRAPVA